jgi:hypothetical protein
MAIEYRNFESASTTTVVTTECPFCGASLDEQQSLADHIRADCTEQEGER